jgi:hypothetical protein
VGGGELNDATATNATVGGGNNNNATGTATTVSGGVSNDATAANATVGGGSTNNASANASTVGGGQDNNAIGAGATVSGGYDNSASGSGATTGGGLFNAANGEFSSVGGGAENNASGSFAAVPGGSMNLAGGEYSFAAGRRARVRDAAAAGDADGDQGTFVWADGGDPVNGTDFVSTGPNQFLIRASGGVGIGTNAPNSMLNVAGEIRSTNATGGQFTAYNPNNQGASVHLSWLDNVARIRYGGTGAGSTNGLDIQGPSDNSKLRILNNGNIGIGTPSPTARLHVAGTAGVDGIRFPDGTLQTSAANILRVSHVQDLGSIASGSFATVVATVTGAAVGSVAHCSLDDLPSGLAIVMVRVSGADTVAVRVQNLSLSAINPPSITWEIAVIP